MLKKILKICFIFIAAFTALVTLAVIGAHFYLKTDPAVLMVRDKINAAIPGQIGWDQADISLLRGRIDLAGAVVKGPDGKTVIAAEQLLVNFGLLELLGGHIAIESGRLRQPEVLLETDAGGNLNLDSVFSEPGPESPAPETEEAFPFNIRIDHLEITSGTLKYQAPYESLGQTPQLISLEHIEAHIRGADLADRSGRIDLTVGDGVVQMAGIETRIEQFEFETELDRGRLSPLALNIRTTGPNLSLTGSITELFDQPRLDLKLDLAADLSLIREFLDLDTELYGPMRIALALSGHPDNPQAVLNANYGGGSLAGVQLTAAELGARMEGLAVNIGKLSLDTGRGKLIADGRINLEPAFTRGLLGGSVDPGKISYDLVLDSRSLSLESIPWITGILSGQVSGTFSFAGTGVDPDTLSAKAAADLNSPNFTIDGALDPTGVRLSGSARMEGGTITTAPLDIGTGGSLASITGDYRIFDNALDAGLIIKSPNLVQILEPFGFPAASGPSELNARVTGPVMNLAADAAVESINLSYQDMHLGDTRAELRLMSSGRLAIDRLLIENKGSQLFAEGTLDLFNHSFADFNANLPADLTVKVSRFDPGDFIPGLNTEGIINGTLRLTRSLASPEADLSLEGSGLVYQGTRIGDVKAQAGLSDGKLNLERMEVKNRQSSLNLSGSADLLEPGTLSPSEQPSLDLDFSGTIIEIGNFTDAASGRLALEGGVSGPLKDLSASLAISGDDISAGGRPMGDLTGNIRLENGRVRLDPVKLQNQKSAIILSGGIDLLEPGTPGLRENPGLDLSISGQSISLGDFDDSLSGRIDVDGKIGGTLADLQGHFGITGQQIDTGVQQFDRIEAGGRLEGRKIHLDSATIALAPDDQVEARGWISLDREYDLRITSDPIDLREIGVFANAGFTRGDLKLSFSGAGSLEAPDFSGSLQLLNLAVDGRAVPDFNLRAELKDQVLDLDAKAGFDLNARYHLKSAQFRMNADFSRTDLSPYLQLAGWSGLDGRLTGTMEASGRVPVLEQSVARLAIADLVIREGETELIQARGFTAAFENGRYHIPEARVSLLGEGYLTVSGSGNISGNLDFAAEGAIPVKVVTVFFQDIQNPSGRADLSADLSGTVENPQFHARITLNEVGMVLPELMQQLHRVNGRIHLDDKEIRFDQVTGKLDTGDLNIDGAISLDGLRPDQADLRIEARALPIQIPDTLELLVNGRLALTGSSRDAVLKGEITFLEGIYFRDVNLSLIGALSEFGQRRRQVAPREPEISYEAPFIRNLALDVAIGYRNPLLVDNNLALLDLKPALRLGGTLNRPLVSGRAEISQGTVSYRDTEFTVQKGVADFINPYRIEPSLDIRAVSEVRQWNIVLAISGTPDNLNFKLSSDPPLEDADILSLLVTGRTTAELGEGGGEGRSPEQMLTSLIAGRLAKDIEETTGFDVEVQYQREELPSTLRENGSELGEDEADGESVRVTVGKELSRRLTVKYGVERKSGEVVQERTAIYRLLENLSVNAFQDTEGTFGGEMTFRLEFR